MTGLRSICLCIVFLLSITASFAQDLIVKTDGSKIYCRIVRLDSTKIYYLRKPQKTQFEINRNEVSSVEVAPRMNAPKMAAESAPDTATHKKEVALIFGVYGGLANALGDFKSKNINNRDAGFANNGGIFHINAVLRFSRYFGISAAYRYQQHSFDTDSYAAQAASFQPPGAVYHTYSAKYTSSGAYGGVYFTLPVTADKRLGLDLDLSAGFPTYTLPELKSIIVYNNNLFSEAYSSSTTTSMTLLAGLGLHYKLSRHAALNFNVSYLYSKPSFRNILYTSSWGLSGYLDYTQKINTLNVQAGLSFFIFDKSPAR